MNFPQTLFFDTVGTQMRCTYTKHSKNAKNMLSYHGPLPAKLVFPKALLLDRYYARLPKEVLFLHHGALDVFQHAF